MAVTSRRRVRRLLAVLALALLVLLFWRALWRTDLLIETESVRRGSLELSVSALGTLQPHRYVDVGAQVSGQIKHIAVDVGDTVVKGDLLVEIDPAVQLAMVNANRATLDSLRAQLAEQQAQLELAKLKAARQQRLHRHEATSIELLQEAQAHVRITQARVSSLTAQIAGAQSTLEGNEALLGYTRIYAPMDGTIITLEAREGQTLNATYQTPNLLRLADLTSMTVWTEVSEADVGRVRPGMPVYFTTLGLLDGKGESRRWESRLRQVLPAPPVKNGEGGVDSSGSKAVSYTALFDVENTDGSLMPQMSARVFFVEASAQNVLLAPLAGMQATPDQDVFTARVSTGNERLETRSIKIGMKDRLYVEVVSGLEEGEALVMRLSEESGAKRLRW
ncbi:efflux RND transporter periplasmic adaptor subunit [Alcaligenes nematophilus]|uniref:Efflux RND transporter periplasmic adaptor subunit n=1 Tax=Alcaligenes nematophilus TaxID=2994643 RepID=A0ABU3MS53_9BURK|nr:MULTISPECIES: efflux RND transporter periplasmic adaptor subunit [Alcaligenes]MDT8466214.1 efflux RND transporter periplasmic adaptor subunit [Alcaligenes nematophilus]MDT8469433.1 efflux RND transporter periplasmic adaptor subunit [Alcaligenes nematophilus]MDT8504252.1 efflux RND transporter periplasmic adaptor subunit [Alcaligenes nematophilus]MDT8525251.1 efflux RND transporter periplasmic adaptor subunit [Alcaligenes nematophilus]QRF90380.1 efflux transporter periplasmic adaptor subunit